MPEEVTAETTLTIPDSSKDSQAVPQAEVVIAAAVETGKAQQAAESAATEAKEAVTEAKSLIEQVRETVRAELAPIQERLSTLEAEEADELITPDEEGDTQEIAIAETVSIEEPPKQPESTLTKQEETPQESNGSGGFLRRIFLNR